MTDVLLDTPRTSCQNSDEETRQRVAERKANSWTLARNYAKFDHKRAGRVQKCGMTAVELAPVGGGRTRHLMSFLCQDRFCAICARKRSAKLARRYRAVLEEECRGLFGHMLTLTYKNSDQLRERARISKDIRNLMRRPVWKRHGGIVGGLYGVEVTRGEGGWHPHVHLLIYTRHPIASYSEGKREGQWLVALNQEVSDAWLDITGDSFVVQGETSNGDVEEIVKYMTKAPESLPTDKLRELTNWARGMRAVSAFGCLYAKKVPEEVEEEPISEGGEFVATVRRFDGRTKQYVVLKTMLIQLELGATVRDVFAIVARRE